MDIEVKIRQISNIYYNRGLTKAKNRDLTGAAADLKCSLRYNKYHTDARNLLGLIYNETGEAGAAMAQWIISLNLQEKDNIASEYLHRAEEARGYLELADQAAKKYNQALSYAQNGNEDLAVLLLMRMLDEFPKYVKAQELLALLYLHNEDYTKAGRCLYQASRVDRYNPTVQRYMDIAKRNTGRAEVERKKIKNAFSHRQMQDDDIIMPPTYKENTGWQSVLNILAGLIIGAVVTFFLAIPASRESMNRKHNEEIRENLEVINQKNIEIDELRQEAETAAKEKEEAEASLASFTSDDGGVIKQYQQLAELLDCLINDDMQNAVLLYINTEWSILQQNEALTDTLTLVYQRMVSDGYQILESMGDTAMTGDGGALLAVDFYQKSLLIRPDNVAVIFKLGSAYQSMGDVENANQYFGEIIMNYPDSEYAEQAKAQRGY